MSAFQAPPSCGASCFSGWNFYNLAMPERISEAIIMRHRELGESDLVVSFFTPASGFMRGVAKGARRSKVRFVNCLDHFCLVNLEFDTRTKGDLCFIRSGRLIEPFPKMRRDFSAVSVASYAVELAEVLFPMGVVATAMFDLLRDVFLLLEGGGDPRRVRILLEARAMALGGYGVNFSQCCRCGRPYAGQGLAVFVRQKGGIACMACEKACPQSPGLSPLSVGAWRRFQACQSSARDILSMTDPEVEELRPALRLHLDFCLGKRMKSTPFLE
jgi:DNA repair protein RecO (recombination protein O)